MSVVTSKQTQSLVWSQRAVCTVLFLMAELYRCPNAVDDVREGRNCTCQFSSAICWVLYNLLSVVRKHMGKTHLLWDVKIRSESTCLAESLPSTCLAESRPPVLSFIARLRAGFAPTSVLAEDGSVRRWSLHWERDVGGGHLESRG